MDERGASLAAGARAGAEVFEKPSGDGGRRRRRRRRRSGVPVRSCLDLPSTLHSSLWPAHGPLRRQEGAGGCGTGRGLCRLPPVRARPNGPKPGARASLALAANTAEPSCCTAPGRLDDRPSSFVRSLSSLPLGERERENRRRTLSAFVAGTLCTKRGARPLW